MAQDIILTHPGVEGAGLIPTGGHCVLRTKPLCARVFLKFFFSLSLYFLYIHIHTYIRHTLRGRERALVKSNVDIELRDTAQP